MLDPNYSFHNFRFTDVAEVEYVRRYTSSNTKKEIQNIFEKVKESLIRRLKSSSKLAVQLEKDIEDDMRDVNIHVGGSDIVFDVEKAERALGYNDVSSTGLSISRLGKRS